MMEMVAKRFAGRRRRGRFLASGRLGMKAWQIENICHISFEINATTSLDVDRPDATPMG